MCMSVPQIAVFFMRISTSLGPIVGLATSAIQMPGSALAFTSAFIGFSVPVVEALIQHAEFAAGRGERGNGPIEVRARVCGRKLSANARLAHRHDRKREAN